MILKSIRLLVAGVMIFTLEVADASTDCMGTIAYITSYDVGSAAPTLYVALSTGVGFYLPISDPSSKQLFALATAARVTGANVTMTFAATSVNCNTVSWRSDLTAFHY